MHPLYNKEYPGLDWLNSLPPWDGKNFSPLEEPKLILDTLSNPQDAYPCIHIAGTNGKGSVAHYLSSILQHEHPEKKIGLMTSPHILLVEERARINSKPVKSEDLSLALEEIKRVCEELSLNPTYFVAVTCAIFLLFKNKAVHYAVIETGLGGRYDATNLIKKPALSIITSIAIDHEEQLGNTLSSIASNKAGIIKQGTPALCGNIPEEALKVIQSVCENTGVILHTLKDENLSPPSAFTSEFKNLYGYKKSNAKLAYTAGRILKLKTENISKGIHTTELPGRAELIYHTTIPVLLDAAHNPEGIHALLEYLRILVTSHKFSHINYVFGFYSRRNWKELLGILKNELHKELPPCNLFWYSFSNEAVPTKVLASHLDEGRGIDTFNEIFSNPKITHKNSLCVIAGSFKMIEAFIEYDRGV